MENSLPPSPPQYLVSLVLRVSYTRCFLFFVFVFAVSEFLFFIAVGEFHTVLRTCEGLRDATHSFGVSSPALAVSVYHDLYLSLPVSVLSTFSLPCPLFPSCRLSRTLLPLTLLGAPVNIAETRVTVSRLIPEKMTTP
jgi:hypothetical protein